MALQDGRPVRRRGVHPEHQAIRAEQDVPALIARVRELEAERALHVGVEPTIAEELAYRSAEIDRLEAENERLRAAWHSAKARARTARERLDLTAHSCERAQEAAEQAQATLDQMPRCRAPHPIVDHARCELIVQHPGWHAAQVGAWPHARFPNTGADSWPVNSQPAPSGPQTPDLTRWASELADDCLEPYDGTLTLDADGKPFVRVHLAFATDADERDREGFTTRLGRAILREL
ncbi:hypothetical protein ACFQ0M_17065 [Kitasatospora aburaviensis]